MGGNGITSKSGCSNTITTGFVVLFIIHVVQLSVAERTGNPITGLHRTIKKAFVSAC